MSYTAWSVVYGEQPSADKWNALGVNDAGFKDGTLIDNDAILARHINVDVAGNGLSQESSGALQVNVDDSTIEIATNTLQVKDKGITPAKMDFDYAVGTDADETEHSVTAAVGSPATINSVTITMSAPGIVFVSASGKFLASGGTSGECNVLISTPDGATKLAGGIQEQYLTAYLPFCLTYVFSVAAAGDYIFSLQSYRDGSTGTCKIKQDSINAIGFGT